MIFSFFLSTEIRIGKTRPGARARYYFFFLSFFCGREKRYCFRFARPRRRDENKRDARLRRRDVRRSTLVLDDAREFDGGGIN